MGRFFVMAAVVCMTSICGVGPAAAQSVTSTSGAITGRVVDNTGGVLPGVTVTASSPAQMGTRTAVTGEDGSFRLPAVPPGEYRLMFELGGFTTLERSGIQVGLGFTATVNAELKLASLSETVVVSGASPVVDAHATAGSSDEPDLPASHDSSF